MNRIGNLFIAGVAAFLLTGCASAQAQRHSVFAADVENSPQMASIDGQISDLSDRAQALAAEYAEIEKVVLANAKFEGEPEQAADRLNIYVNENNAIIVNDEAMSRNEFSAYADRNLPNLCSPAPTLKVHARANYDIAASLLEVIYMHGCSDVKFE